ncbi:pyridoxal phosphate-dependent decarboxylase family protein [Staphylococcus pseudintermedius]|uniref:pyridoxal phosphate-dependent decarboxylase family protein n=1 Tax=Staphylococcus pseudintermedius TaxID=283734 RepID=UPI002A007B73|nr:aminotransferase class V-fold PLP-dependent enzyme [Staphylococcus pseudintermedius]
MDRDIKSTRSEWRHIIYNEVKNLLNKEMKDLPVALKPTDSMIAKYQHMKIPKEGKGIEAVMDLLHTEVLNYNYRSNHPRTFSFVPGPASQLSWLTDFFTSAHNIHASNFTNAPLPIAIEHRLIRYLSEEIGFDSALSGGVFVSGGSMATLTAITAGRDAMIPLSQMSEATVYLTAQAHFSVAKAFHIAGFAQTQLRYIPTDDFYTMDVNALEQQIELDITNGYRPIMIVATAGTTNTGAIDNLTHITRIARQHQMWVHADGAFGLSHIFTEEGQKLLKDIDKVDSVTWDAHKLLFQTYSCAMVIVKNKNHLLSTYGVAAEYLDDITSTNEHIDPEKLGIELTRPPRGLKLWVTLQVLGENEIKRRIEHGQEMARYVEQQVQQMKNWKIVTTSQLSIINIRYEDPTKTPEENDQVMQFAASRIIQSGYAATYTTELSHRRVIRFCTIHPETTRADIDGTLQRLNNYVQEASSQPQT